MKKILLIFLVLTNQLFSQVADIEPALRLIERGDTKNASTILADLKSKNPEDPSVIFLDALLTKEGDEALKKYSAVLEKFPDSRYADASLYRIFSYYYSLGFYKKAETYLDRLKKDFPESPYIKTADIKLPDVEEPAALVVDKPQTKLSDQPEKADAINYNFTIQAGAFLNVENARKLSEQMKKENYFTEIITKDVGGTILNVVNVGKFVNEEEARPVLSFFENKFRLKGRIVPLGKRDQE